MEGGREGWKEVGKAVSLTLSLFRRVRQALEEVVGQEVQQDKGWKASLRHCSTEVTADQLDNIDGEVA